MEGFRVASASRAAAIWGGLLPTEDRLQVWRTRSIVVGAVLLAGLLASRPSVMVLLVPVAIFGLIVVTRWPALGMVGLVVAALWVPFGISTGTETNVNIAFLLIGGLISLWLVEVLLRRDYGRKIVPSRLLTSMVAFALISVLAFLVGLQPWLPMATTAPLFTQIGGLVIYLFSLGAFLLGAGRLRDEKWLKLLVATFLCIGAMFMAKRIMGSLPFPTVVQQPDGGAAADGSLFWLWVGTLSFSQALLNRRLALAWRGAALALFCATLWLGLANKDWNSGWTPVLVSALVILVLGKPRLAVPVLLVGAAYVAIKLPELADAYVLNDYKQYDLLTRTAAWDILMSIIRIEPVLGIGFGNYYWYTPLYSILGYNVSFNSHNTYVDLTAQTGVIGLLCFAWLMLEIGLLAWRLRNRVPEGFARAYVYAGIGGLVGSLVSAFLGDWLLPFVYNVGMAGFRSSMLTWLFLGALVLLETRYVRAASVAINDPESAPAGCGVRQRTLVHAGSQCALKS